MNSLIILRVHHRQMFSYGGFTSFKALFIASSDLRRNKKTCNCRNASNSVSLDEPLLIISLFVTHRLTLWPCYRACLFMYGNGFGVADAGEGPEEARGARAPSLILDQLEARRAEKIFFFEAGPPYIGVWMTAPPTYGSATGL